MTDKENRVDEVIEKKLIHDCSKEAIKVGINLDEFHKILRPIVKYCTKESIAAGKAWIIETGQSLKFWIGKWIQVVNATHYLLHVHFSAYESLRQKDVFETCHIYPSMGLFWTLKQAVIQNRLDLFVNIYLPGCSAILPRSKWGFMPFILLTTFFIMPIRRTIGNVFHFLLFVRYGTILWFFLFFFLKRSLPFIYRFFLFEQKRFGEILISKLCVIFCILPIPIFCFFLNSSHNTGQGLC